ncbi:MAG: S41 family peptidase [Dehalococcoidales bacterium]|nr:S41 family peptidase [Dehalococcoidales bacterium]
MSKELKIALISVAVVIGLALSFVGGFSLSLFMTTSQQAQGLNLELLNEAYNVIQDRYVDPTKLDDAILTEGAIKGMVDALDDPHSGYMSKEFADMQTSDFEGQFEGIGAYVTSDESGRVVIIAPMVDSPAGKAGILPGDIILGVDGQSTEGMTVNEVVLLIRGPKGTTVQLSVMHSGATDPVTIDVVRDEIEVDSVSLEMKGDIACITISRFTERTEEELIPVLQEILDKDAQGIIIDLRNNPGGILDIVINNVSHFLDNGAVAHVIDKYGNRATSSVEDVSPKILDIPMVVLVNEYSASASEIFAGAMQDHGRALIAGNTTFGKGSVNVLVRLDDGSGIYISVGRWLTPDGNLIEGDGIAPDEAVDFTQVDGIQWAIDYLHSEQ